MALHPRSRLIGASTQSQRPRICSEKVRIFLCSTTAASGCHVNCQSAALTPLATVYCLRASNTKATKPKAPTHTSFAAWFILFVSYKPRISQASEAPKTHTTLNPKPRTRSCPAWRLQPFACSRHLAPVSLGALRTGFTGTLRDLQGFLSGF